MTNEEVREYCIKSIKTIDSSTSISFPTKAGLIIVIVLLGEVIRRLPEG